MRSERGLSTILHCLQWYTLVLRTRLCTAAVQYLVLITHILYGPLKNLPFQAGLQFSLATHARALAYKEFHVLTYLLTCTTGLVIDGFAVNVRSTSPI